MKSFLPELSEDRETAHVQTHACNTGRGPGQWTLGHFKIDFKLRPLVLMLTVLDLGNSGNMHAS